MSNHGRVTRLLAATAVIVGLSAVPSGTAHADGLTVTTSDGRTLHVGDVVASGQRNGDICVFPEDVGINLSGSNTNVATLTADPDCNLSVSKITEVASGAVASHGAVRRKYDESIESGAQPNGVGVGGIDVGGDPGVSVGDLLDPAKPKWERDVYIAEVRQVVYDTAGIRQYEDWFRVQFIEEWNDRDGRVRDVTLLDGQCAGGSPTDAELLEIRSCWYRTTNNGPDIVAARSGGWYRKGRYVGGIGVVTDERKLTETFQATYQYGWEYGCYMDRALPIGWSSECWGDIDTL